MPAALTYPGVYVEEIPSGVRTITGVPTSITAFVGRTPLGPANDATLVGSFGEFESLFGGLAADYPLSYAVRDFYLNGGSLALIVRVFGAPAAGNKNGVATLAVDKLNLVAASPGIWGNGLTVVSDTDSITDAVAAQFGLAAADLFNLTVTLTVNGQLAARERLRNLSVKPDAAVANPAGRARRIDRVLIQSSQLIRLASKADGSPDLPAGPPAAAAPAAPGGAAAPAAPGGAAAPAAPAAPANPSGSGGGGGEAASLKPADLIGDADSKTGLYALMAADIFNLLCIPPDTRGGDTDISVYAAALSAICVPRRAMLIVDSPSAWSANAATAAKTAVAGLPGLNLSGIDARNAALYFPRVIESDPLSQGQQDRFAPCGIVAGIMARTDGTRGVWKAPAGLDASINGIVGFDVELNNFENGELNPLGINCLRSFPPVGGRVIWGARTLRGADQLADDYKYVPVRRLALFLEESLYRGTQWVVFEPNDEPLWSQIRLNVGAFMHGLFVQGAFQGTTPKDAYFVKCDAETTTQNDINLGIVNIVVGYAPLKPAEFVVIKIQQMAGQIAV